MRWCSGKGIPFVLGALSLYILFSAGRMGAASLLCGNVSNELDAWIRNGKQPAAASVSRLSDQLVWAERLASDNPEPMIEQARLALLRAAAPGLIDSERASILDAGLGSLRRALSLRPASPYAWSLLMQLKSVLGQHDAEFRHAIERTVNLGPWETELQPIVLDAGLRAWGDLPAAERDMVRSIYRRGLARDAGRMLQVLLSHPNGCVIASGYDGCVR